MLIADNSSISDRPREWKGYERIDFVVDGCPCYLVSPKTVASGRPWVWRARFPDYHPEVDQQLLAKGFHIAYMNTDGMLGSDAALKHWDAFYQYMTQRHQLARRVTLEAVSRGGLFAYRWAIRNPDAVACIYADVPVLDFKSWPLGNGVGKGHMATWEILLKEYGFNQQQALEYTGNPVDNLRPLAQADIPIYHVISLNDRIVPAEENTLKLQEIYKKMGGEIIVETVPEGTKKSDGHHFTLPAPNKAVNFIVKNNFDMLVSDHDYFTLRNDLKNCRQKFEQEKQGRVVFLGGSITYGGGWRPMVSRQLQRRFPSTRFEFINAGIPSTGSVTHAFRTRRDVFGKGTVDLVFVEAAVNDATNRPDQPNDWRRGMEGIIRCLRQESPYTDIVMLHFADPEKIASYDGGQTPAVIAEHEKVAEHYQLSSIHLAREVAERIRSGQFTWAEDFRNLHPSVYGHRLYASAIKRMLDAAWKTPSEDILTRPEVHASPDPLDPLSYFQGRLVNITEAKTAHGWKIKPKWHPQSGGTRAGFVDVPMLVADQGGAELTFQFRGTAVGLWIVAGPDVGIIEYKIDDQPIKRLDQFTQWSSRLHLPWLLILADELEDRQHTLFLRTSTNKNEKSKGTACRIFKFCVNGNRTPPDTY